jgi:hypothetical protein
MNGASHPFSLFSFTYSLQDRWLVECYFIPRVPVNKNAAYVLMRKRRV